MSTGTGKTITAVSLIEDLKQHFQNPNLKVLWGTHLEELVEQSAITLLAELNLMPYSSLISLINNAGGLIQLMRDHKNDMFVSDEIKLILSNIGIVKADLFDIDKPITVASMQTLWRRLDKIPFDSFDVFICDEAHLFGSNSFLKSLNHFDVKLRLGLTATPHREDGMLMGDIFDEIVYEYGIDKGIEDGYLCELEARQIKTTTNIDKARTTAGEFNQKDLEVLVNTRIRNQLIVDKYKEYALGRQFIAYCVDIQHALDLHTVFCENECKTQIVVGDVFYTPDRRKILQQFKEKEFDGLTNCMVLTTGFDYPDLGCIINAAPTKSLTKFIQCVGRGARLKSQEYVDKFGQNCLILDVVDNTSKHRLVNTWTLDKAKPIEEKTFLTKQQKLTLIAAREAKYRPETNLKKDKIINLLQLPKATKSKSIRMQEDATEKQLEWIKGLGYNVDTTHYTKEMCSDIISAQSASPKQIAFLKWKGYDVSEGVTIGEAQAAFDIINNVTPIAQNKPQPIAEQELPWTDIN